MDDSIDMMACLAYNAINVIAWCALACHFGHWWIALFAVITQMSLHRERKDVKPKEFLYGEYSEEFDRLRKNRVQMSYHKYGPAAKNFGEGGWTPT